MLKCDNGTYISFWPLQKGMPLITQWHSQQQDDDFYYQGPKPDETCFDCLNEGKVREWLDKAKTSQEWGFFKNNCSDATANAIISGLRQPQSKPCCPGGSYLKDLLDHSGLNSPADTMASVQNLKKNGCNRYGCEKYCIPPPNPYMQHF